MKLLNPHLSFLIGDSTIYITKIGKQSILNVMNIFMMVKLTLKCFGFIKPSSGLYDGEKIIARTMMGIFTKITGEEKVYTKKDP